MEVNSLIPTGDQLGYDPLRPMTLKESEMFISLMMLELSEAPLTDELRAGFSYQIIASRLGTTGIPLDKLVSNPMIVLAGYLAGGNPGKLVMWAYTIKTLFVLEKERVTVEIFSRGKYFGWGVPSDKHIEAVWTAQKMKSEDSLDNKLDTLEVWTDGITFPP